MPSATFVAGALSFPGIDDPIKATINRTLGVRPTPSMIWYKLQAGSPDTSGTSTFTFGSTTNLITMNNCLCDLTTVQVTEHGNVMSAVIFDKRWRWVDRGTPVVGAYNVRLPNNTIDSTTQKTLAQLATILFTALGDPTADVSAITSTEYAFVAWDFADPANELAALLEPRGYVISLQLDDTIKVFAKGTGATLPVSGDLVTANISVDPPEVPNTIRLVCNQTLLQLMFLMAPVGIETDLSVKLVKDLSYNPGLPGNANGWNSIDLTTMAAITPQSTRDLALFSVGRMFQAVSLAQGTQASPAYDVNFGGVNYIPGVAPNAISVTNISQFFPLKPFLLSTADALTGKPQYNRAVVSGTFFDKSAGVDTPPYTTMNRRDWRLMTEFGNSSIILFNEPALMNGGTGGNPVTFATVYFTCTCSVHDATVQVKDRYTRDKSLGGYGIDLQKVEELQRQLVAGYDLTGTIPAVNGLTDNKSTVDTNADLYLNAAALKYATMNANVLVYRDIQTIATDGVAWQIQWHVASGHPPFHTLVSQNAESIPLLATAAEQARLRMLWRNGDPTNKTNNKYLGQMYGETAPGGQGTNPQ